MMKRLIVFLLIGIVFCSGQLVNAKLVEVDSKVVVVSQDELAEFASQEKFEDIDLMMKKLVQDKVSTEVNEIKLEEIKIIKFEYEADGRIKIYYQKSR